MTGGRYQDLLIDPAEGISLSVFVPETGERQPMERLSRGDLLDQMYLCMPGLDSGFFQNMEVSRFRDSR